MFVIQFTFCHVYLFPEFSQNDIFSPQFTHNYNTATTNDLTLGYQTSDSVSSSNFHHLALLLMLVLHSSNFHHRPLLALLVALVLHLGDSANFNFSHPIV